MTTLKILSTYKSRKVMRLSLFRILYNFKSDIYDVICTPLSNDNFDSTEITMLLNAYDSISNLITKLKEHEFTNE